MLRVLIPNNLCDAARRAIEAQLYPDVVEWVEMIEATEIPFPTDHLEHTNC